MFYYFTNAGQFYYSAIEVILKDVSNANNIKAQQSVNCVHISGMYCTKQSLWAMSIIIMLACWLNVTWPFISAHFTNMV